MVEIVWRVRNDITGEEVANFLMRPTEAVIGAKETDRNSLHYGKLYAKGEAELAAIALCRELNSGKRVITFVVSQGHLVRAHKIPALRNVVI